jgi:general secretion pathway protein J
MRSLVYYELPVYTKSYEDIDRNYIFGDYKKGRSLKLLAGVEGIEFSFYGYDTFERKFRWKSDFEGEKIKLLPSSIIISYQQDGRKSKLVFGINVNSSIKAVYNDIYLRQ